MTIGEVESPTGLRGLPSHQSREVLIGQAHNQETTTWSDRKHEAPELNALQLIGREMEMEKKSEKLS